jgi:hypothetical protein
LKIFRSLVVTLTVAALFAGCGGGSGVRFSDLFDESAAAEGTGVQFSGLVRAVVILAKHDASARQRQVAEQNGRRAVAKLQARIAASSRESAPAPKTKPRRKKTSTAAKAAKPEPKSKASGAQPKPVVVAEPESETAPVKPKPQKKLPRIIAVATEKDERTDKKAAKAVMLFDTHAQQIIGNKVYDIESEPQPGEEVRFETHSTSYIGASL